MKKTKFQIIQQWLSLIPFWSTLFIAIVTYIVLYRKKVSVIYWVKYGLNFFISAIAVTLLNGIVMTGEHIILNIIASAALLVLTNCYFVQIQFEVMQKEQSKENISDVVSTKSKSFVPKRIIILRAIPIILFVLGVTVFIGYRIVDNFTANADTNGPDDFSVVTIKDEEIAETNYSNSSAFLVSSFTEGSHSDVSDKRIEEVDYDKTRYTSSSLSGIYVANVTKTNSNSMSLRITSTVESGNTEIYVFIDNTLHSKVNINETVELFLEDISDKTVYVKVACESAKISIEVEREITGAQ